MSTLLEMKRDIARDLVDDKALSSIPHAIESAISWYEKYRFFFNEERATATTTANQMSYALPTDYIEADHMQLEVSSNQYRLDRIVYADLVENDLENNATGQPSQWCIYEDQIFLWPIPDASTYTMTLSYVKSLAALTDSASNAWTTSAYDLIKSRAEWDIAMRIMKDQNLSARYKAAEIEALECLTRETSQRASSGRIRPRYL